MDLFLTVVGSPGPGKDTAGGKKVAESFTDILVQKGGNIRIAPVGCSRSNAAGRREREIALQLPEKAAKVHEIRTDDPPGIESYWHQRFSAKRLNGEWFDLAAADVRAFKRRKFM